MRKKLKQHSLNILDIPDELLREIILKYLTIYENYQLLFVFKNIKIDWCYLQNRDFYTSPFPLSKYNAIHLDNGNLFEIGLYTLIPKTTAMKSYCLSTKDLENIEPSKIERNPKGYKSQMKLYEIRKVRNLSASKHFGFTNLKLKRIIYSKKRNKGDRFEIWLDKKEITNKQLYITMTPKERQDLLYIKLEETEEYHTRLYKKNNFELCKNFISGIMLTKSVEEIVSIIALRNEISIAGIQNIKQQYFEDQLQQIKFKNNYLSWIECVYQINLY